MAQPVSTQFALRDSTHQPRYPAASGRCERLRSLRAGKWHLAGLAGLAVLAAPKPRLAIGHGCQGVHRNSRSRSEDGRAASYVCAVSEGRANLVGVAAIDPANAGEILLAQFPDNHRFRRVVSLLHKLQAQELLVPASHTERFFAQMLRSTFGASERASERADFPAAGALATRSQPHTP